MEIYAKKINAEIIDSPMEINPKISFHFQAGTTQKIGK